MVSFLGMLSKFESAADAVIVIIVSNINAMEIEIKIIETYQYDMNKPLGHLVRLTAPGFCQGSKQ